MVRPGHFRFELRRNSYQQVVAAEGGDQLDSNWETGCGSMEWQGDCRLTGHVELRGIWHESQHGCVGLVWVRFVEHPTSEGETRLSDHWGHEKVELAPPRFEVSGELVDRLHGPEVVGCRHSGRTSSVVARARFELVQRDRTTDHGPDELDVEFDRRRKDVVEKREHINGSTECRWSGRLDVVPKRAKQTHGGADRLGAVRMRVEAIERVHEANAKCSRRYAHLAAERACQRRSAIGIAYLVASDASSSAAASRTVRVNAPSCARPLHASPRKGPLDTRPREDLRPTSPFIDAGIRIEPPPSLP